MPLCPAHGRSSLPTRHLFSNVLSGVGSRAPPQRAMGARHSGGGHAAAPLLRFGVVSDIQYADIPDGHSFHGVPRYYRNALVALKRAVAAWRQQGDLDFAIHMGDILDGFQPKDQSDTALSAILSEFELLGRPTYHLIGNHCLYNLARPVLNDRLGLGHGCASGVSYYSIQPHKRLRVVFADGYDISVLGWPKGHPSHEEAVALLAARNPNPNKNHPEGLVGPDRRFVQFGGGASARQLEWIRGQILEAAAQGQKVLVCCHLAFCPGSCPNACLLWNYEEMLEVLRTTAPGVVVASMAGHTHQNGYVLDEWGIHHVVLPAVLETPPGRDCYGQIHVYEHGLELHGVDTMMSLSLPFLTREDMAAGIAFTGRGDGALEQGAVAGGGNGAGGMGAQQERVRELVERQAQEKLGRAAAVAVVAATTAAAAVVAATTAATAAVVAPGTYTPGRHALRCTCTAAKALFSRLITDMRVSLPQHVLHSKPDAARAVQAALSPRFPPRDVRLSGLTLRAGTCSRAAACLHSALACMRPHVGDHLVAVALFGFKQVVGFESLSHLLSLAPHLSLLSFPESVVSGSALGALQPATRLRCLSFDRLVAVDSDEVIVGFMGDSADDTAWAPLSRLGSVERLHVGLHECEWPLADALAAVSGLTGLQELDVTVRFDNTDPWSGAGDRVLGDLPQLSMLRPLGQLAALRVQVLAPPADRDAPRPVLRWAPPPDAGGWPYAHALAQLPPQLTRLSLPGMSMTAATLATVLAALTSLHTLELGWLDAGSDEPAGAQAPSPPPLTLLPPWLSPYPLLEVPLPPSPPKPPRPPPPPPPPPTLADAISPPAAREAGGGGGEAGAWVHSLRELSLDEDMLEPCLLLGPLQGLTRLRCGDAAVYGDRYLSLGSWNVQQLQQLEQQHQQVPQQQQQPEQPQRQSGAAGAAGAGSAPSGLRLPDALARAFVFESGREHGVDVVWDPPEWCACNAPTCLSIVRSLAPLGRHLRHLALQSCVVDLPVARHLPLALPRLAGLHLDQCLLAPGALVAAAWGLWQLKTLHLRYVLVMLPGDAVHGSALRNEIAKLCRDAPRPLSLSVMGLDPDDVAECWEAALVAQGFSNITVTSGLEGV